MITFPDALQTTERDGLTLVCPNKGKFMTPTEWQEWLPYRSAIIDSNDNFVSMGFKKFFNWGESLEDTDLLEKSLKDNEPVYFTEKMDGSLCVRSVINKKVIFRTRGTFDGGDFEPHMRKIAEEKYPILLNPDFLPHGSLLLEFVSSNPEYRIVIKYQEDDLILIGYISHFDQRMYDIESLKTLAERYKLNLVPIHELSRDPDELLETVEKFEDKEGIVVRFARGQKLIKLKGAKYLALHRLYSHMTPKMVREICDQHYVRTPYEFQEYLEQNGGDWEIFTELKPYVEKHIAVREEAEKEFSALYSDTIASIFQWPARKDFAINFATKLNPACKSAAFMLLDGKNSEALAMLISKRLDEAFEDA